MRRLKGQSRGDEGRLFAFEGVCLRQPRGKAEVHALRRNRPSRRRGAAQARRAGTGKGLPHVRRDHEVAGGRRSHQGSARGVHDLPHRPLDRAGRRGAAQDAAARAADRPARRGGGAEARPDGRAVPRLATALPPRDRQGAAPHGRSGGDARQADRARRHAREAAHDRGEPAARRLDREGVPGPRPDVPRPDPGRLARPDPGGREVRLPQGVQVLDVRDLVDPAGGHARDRRQGANDPDPGAHGREAQQGRPHRAPARPAAWVASLGPRRSRRSSR